MAIVVNDVRKNLAGKRILDGISLVCDSGAITALTGANGAGKSTLLRIIAGILEPDRGTVTIAGRDLVKMRTRARQILGYVPEAADAPGHMTGDELFALVSALKRVAPLSGELRKRLGIGGIADRRIEQLSLGERRRICVAAALIGDPRVLVLDEPTNGLDQNGMAELAAVLEGCRERGTAVLIATHNAEFARALADTHLHLEGGRVELG